MAVFSLTAQVASCFICLAFAQDPQELNMKANIMIAGSARRRSGNFLSHNGPTVAPRPPLENSWRMSDKSLWRPSAAFKIFDGDENEVLSRKEIVDGSNMDGAMAYPKFLQDFDDDRDGFISIKEFDRDPIAAFRLLDMDGSGRVNSYELVENGNLDLARAARYVQMMDKDGDGLVSLEEYKQKHGSDKLDFVSLKAIKNEKSDMKLNAKKRQRGFNHFDADKDGMLSGEEINAVGSMNSESLRNFFKDFDKDHDGKIDLAEFTATQGAPFKLFDQNSDGKVTLSELQRVGSLNEDDAIGFMQEIDEDENESLSQDEFDFTGFSDALPTKKEMAPQKELEGIKKIKAPQEERSPASAAFKMLDVDESSGLTPFELIEAAKFSKQQVLDYFRKYDTNGNSQISATEFERKGSAAFEAYDIDRSGVVDQKELQEVNNLRKSTAAAYIERFDLNEDGVIQPKEFKRTAMPPADARKVVPAGTRVPLAQLAANARTDLRRTSMQNLRSTARKIYQQTIKDVVEDIRPN